MRPADQISIHAPLAGSDQSFNINVCALVVFRSTLPLRGATAHLAHQRIDELISIHAPLAGSDRPRVPDLAQRQSISIHAPLAGSDRQSELAFESAHHFDPRSPCGERPCSCSFRILVYVFRSTLPLRGATAFELRQTAEDVISIHAPLAGSDPNDGLSCGSQSNFDPRSPCGERLD